MCDLLRTAAEGPQSRREAARYGEAAETRPAGLEASRRYVVFLQDQLANDGNIDAYLSRRSQATTWRAYERK